MKDKTTRVFGYTDIHWASRSEAALKLARRAQAAFKPHKVVFGGDLLNAGPFARHPKISTDQDADYDLLETELNPIKRFIEGVETDTINKEIDIVMGNHDDWIERFCCRSGIGKALRSMRPSNYLTTGLKKVRVLPYGRLDHDRTAFLRLHPRLIVVHGWAENKFAADTHLQLAKPFSIIYHHTHRADQRMGTMADGKLVQAMCAGCLCKKQPIYAHGGKPTEWVHGFWVAYLGSKTFTMYSVPIWENHTCVLPDGQEIRL